MRTLLPTILPVWSLLAMEEVLARVATLLEPTLHASKVQVLVVGPTGPKPLLVELASHPMPTPYLCLCPSRLCPTEIPVLGPVGCPYPCPFLAVG